MRYAGPLTPEVKAKIDAMTLKEMLYEWRFAPIGSFETSETSDYFEKSMKDKRSVDEAGWVKASKEIGW